MPPQADGYPAFAGGMWSEEALVKPRLGYGKNQPQDIQQGK